MAFLVVAVGFAFGPVMGKIGSWVVVDDPLESADAVVVLNTGLEYYPRLIQAAEIYTAGVVDYVVINGNRKTDVIRRLEAEGFRPCCSWYANSLQVLRMYGVPEEKVIPISAEDAYDTISEARAVGWEIRTRNWQRIVVTTSKFHTRRARHIWKMVLEGEVDVKVAAAQSDPYDPQRWWKKGRQVRWVLAEYGAWLFFWWNTTFMEGKPS